MATQTDDFLTHPVQESFSAWGDGPTGYFGQTLVALAPNLTQIEFEIDPFVSGFGPGPTNYTVLVASVSLDSNGNFLHPDQVLFESTPLTFRVDGSDFNWERVSVSVEGLDLTVGETYAFLLNANFGGNAGRGAARVAGIGVDEDAPPEPAGTAFAFHGNLGSTAADFGASGWFLLSGDLAYRLTYDDTPRPPGIVLPGTNKDDDLVGTAGDDEISGGNGSDTISGAGGDDKINGGNGNDLLFGDAGDDILDGGSNGADTLNGGSGNNTLSGGNGKDNFDFGSSASGNNTVTDFVVGQDHFRLFDGVTVIKQTDTAAGLELALSNTGHVLFSGVQVADWHVLI
jgi:Ca2+-binding RTX toxin-like protein